MSCRADVNDSNGSIVDELRPDFVDVGTNSREPECVSIAWSADGQTLFGGFTDHLVRVCGVVVGGMSDMCKALVAV